MASCKSERTSKGPVAVPAKLTSPEPGRYFSRPALEQKLAGFVEAPRKVWISSPGGAGKTSLVSNFLTSDPRPLFWYQVDSEDLDPATLFIYLAKAMEHDADSGLSLPQFMPEYLANLGVFCRSFCRKLFAGFEAGFVLVFDDLQEGPGESLFGPFLAAAMAELPQNSALLLLSREEPYRQFAKDRLNRTLAHLGWEDLRLSAEESRCFLSWSREDDPPQALFDRAYDLTQGWLAGLLLFPESPGEGGHPQRVSLERTDLLFDYFADEILARLPDFLRDFLFTCSILQTVEVTTAEKLTGRADAGVILRRLVRENHFTCRIFSTPETFRFHPLFRHFLLTRTEQVLSALQLADIRERAARLLMQAGQNEQAADLLIDACAWQPMIELIESQAERLLQQGRSQTLLLWLDAVPEHLKNAIPWLYYWRGCCLLATNPAIAREELSRAFELFEREGNAVGSMLSWGMVVNAIVVGWDDYAELDRWIERFDRLRDRYSDYPSPEIEALMVQGICKSLAWRQPTRADLSDWALRLHQIVTTSRDSTYRLLAGSNLAYYYIMSGNLATAHSLVECLDSDLHSPVVSPLKKLIWLATRAVIERVLLDRSGCLATIEAGRAVIEESGVHLLDLRLYGQGITLGLTTGDLSLVRQLLAELPSVPIVAALDQALFSLLQADFSLMQGDTAKGVALAEMAVGRAEAGGSPAIKAMSLAVLTLALHQDGQNTRVTEVLAQGLAISKGMDLFDCDFHLLAAFFALETRQGETARELLCKGFALAARQGRLNFQPWRDEIMTRLCREAITAGIEVDYVIRLASVHKLDISPLVSPNLTPKETETLTWVQEGKTTWEIAKILGVSQGTVKFHVGNILRKLGASSRPQAVAIALKAGLLKERIMQ
jgi:LuxR family transcriptional regulator, maltose regulon positive regulatory protein